MYTAILNSILAELVVIEGLLNGGLYNMLYYIIAAMFISSIITVLGVAIVLFIYKLFNRGR